MTRETVAMETPARATTMRMFKDKLQRTNRNASGCVDCSDSWPRNRGSNQANTSTSLRRVGINRALTTGLGEGSEVRCEPSYYWPVRGECLGSRCCLGERRAGFYLGDWSAAPVAQLGISTSCLWLTNFRRNTYTPCLLSIFCAFGVGASVPDGIRRISQ
jgi:hypothetical protein